jgi:hypothetical protein
MALGQVFRRVLRFYHFAFHPYSAYHRRHHHHHHHCRHHHRVIVVISCVLRQDAVMV